MKIIQHQNSLEYIVLSQSMLFDDSCVNKLAKALHYNTCMKVLHLVGCKLKSKGTEALADMLKVNNTLKWIELRDNRETLKEEDIILLMYSIYHHNNTVHVHVST